MLRLRVRRDIQVVAADEDTSLGFTSDMMAMRGKVFTFDIISPQVVQTIVDIVGSYPVDEGDLVLLSNQSKENNSYIWRADWLEHVSSNRRDIGL